MDKLARFYREMTDEQKGDLRRILIGGVIFILGEILSHTVPFFMGYGGLILFIPAWGVLGAEVLWSALKNIRHGQVFDENFLMCIASIGTFSPAITARRWRSCSSSRWASCSSTWRSPGPAGRSGS